MSEKSKDKFFVKPHTVTLTIEEDIYLKLKKISRAEEMSVGPYIRKILKQHLNYEMRDINESI